MPELMSAAETVTDRHADNVREYLPGSILDACIASDTAPTCDFRLPPSWSGLARERDHGPSRLL